MIASLRMRTSHFRHWSRMRVLSIAAPLIFGLVGGCSTQQVANSETMAVLDTVAWSPDGRQIAAGRNLFNIIFLYDPSDLHRTGVLSGEQEDMWGRIRAQSIAYSADGRYLAAAGIDGQVVVWDIASRSEKLRLKDLHDAKLIAFSPKAAVLAAAGPENAVTLWSIPEGEKLATLAHPAEVTSMAFSFDGQLLATGGSDRTARIWKTSDASLAAQLSGHDHPVTSLAFSPDSATLATYAATVTLWEPFKRSVDLKFPKQDTGMLRTMQLAALISNIASVGMGGGPGIYAPIDVAAEKRGKEKAVEDRLPVLFSRDGRFLAVMRFNPTLSTSYEILVINRQTEKAVSLRCNCRAMAFSPDSDKLISAGTKLTIWDPLTGNSLVEH